MNEDFEKLNNAKLGRFKNKKVKIKTIETDEFGMPIINGRPACTFRMVPNPRS